MTVNTGVWRNSGTTSCVSVVIYGKEGKSGVINLNKNFKEEKEGKDNPVFSRASTDHFLVCVDKSLGPLTTLHVAHDNSGNDPSWFLEDVAIKDTSTQDTEIFDCRGWLALEKGDGNIERVLTSRGEKGRMDFKNELSSRTSHSLTEGHIWFSVVAKHPKSNFTRAQRTSCCLLILYSAMLASAMFYKEGTTEQAVHVGPFKFTWKELIVSVESAIVIAPITVLVVTLFRKSRPRARRRRAQPHLLNSNEEPQNKTNQVQSYPLPHWCIYIGWVLCVLASFTAALFVVFYSLTFGKEKSNRWLTAVVLSCTQDIFVSQPLRLLVVAVIVAYLRAKRAEVGQKRDGKGTTSTVSGTEIAPLSLLSPESIERARENQKLQQQLFSFLREAILFIFFLLLLLAVCFGGKDGSSYYMKNSVSNGLSGFDQVLRNLI